MPKHYQKHHDVDSRQHSGLGTYSEPFSDPKSQKLYDEAEREYRAMLSFEGINDDKAGNDKARLPEELLLPDIGGGRVLRAQEILPEPVRYAGGQDCTVRYSALPDAGRIAECNERPSDRGLTFHTKVVVLIAAAALVVVGCAWMIGSFLMSAIELKWSLEVSPISGLYWFLGAFSAYAVTCIIIYSILKVASLSDQQVAEMGGQQ